MYNNDRPGEEKTCCTNISITNIRTEGSCTICEVAEYHWKVDKVKIR